MVVQKDGQWLKWKMEILFQDCKLQLFEKQKSIVLKKLIKSMQRLSSLFTFASFFYFFQYHRLQFLKLSKEIGNIQIPIEKSDCFASFTVVCSFSKWGQYLQRSDMTYALICTSASAKLCKNCPHPKKIHSHTCHDRPNAFRI